MIDAQASFGKNVAVTWFAQRIAHVRPIDSQRDTVPLLIVIKHKSALCGRKAFQMVVHITELSVDHGQPLEEVADIQLFRHAHAAM